MIYISAQIKLVLLWTIETKEHIKHLPKFLPRSQFTVQLIFIIILFYFKWLLSFHDQMDIPVFYALRPHSSFLTRLVSTQILTSIF